MTALKKKLKQVPGLMWGCLLIVVIFAFVVPDFTRQRNIINILNNTSILLLVSCGMTMAILSQQIDMSIGGVMSFSAMMSGMYINQFQNPTTFDILCTFLIGIAVGLAFGLFNGLMIGKFRYNFWLVTFATMNIGYGAAQVTTEGSVISGFGKAFRNITGSDLFKIPSLIFICAAVVAIFIFLTYRTRFGMHIYAIGDSENCAAQSGIHVERTRIALYTLSGLLAGIGGVLLISKTNSASPIVANGYEFQAIAAVIVGGTSFEGGKGGIIGTIVGTIIIGSITNGLELFGVSNYWEQVFTGIFILVIILIDVINVKRKKGKMLKRVYKT